MVIGSDAIGSLSKRQSARITRPIVPATKYVNVFEVKTQLRKKTLAKTVSIDGSHELFVTDNQVMSLHCSARSSRQQPPVFAANVENLSESRK
jgi:hypothetical protein